MQSFRGKAKVRRQSTSGGIVIDEPEETGQVVATGVAEEHMQIFVVLDARTCDVGSRPGEVVYKDCEERERNQQIAAVVGVPWQRKSV